MSLPIINVQQMREWENATWKSGRTEMEVMIQAGRAVANQAMLMTRPGDRILILAGKGHNGDDALLGETELVDRPTRSLRISDPGNDYKSIKLQLREGVELIIDGLFGIGLNRPLNEDWKRLINRVNRTGTPILSVDNPSGLNADDGRNYGTAIKAKTTLTLGSPKLGLFQPQALEYVGKLVTASDIGLVPCPIESDFHWLTQQDKGQFSRQRMIHGHKGSFGHLLISAGSVGYHGAAVLCARGAQRAMPGLITLHTQPEAYIPIASQLQSVMVHPWTPELSDPKNISAHVIGPGLASESIHKGIFPELMKIWELSPHPVVADASALDHIRPGKIPSKGIRVITPHPGEAARMLRISSSKIMENRWQSLRSLSKKFGNCYVVLKGHQTLIGRSAGRVYVNPTGNSDMAQGGSGDVLSGYLGGFLAQTLLANSPLETICYAVYQHGLTADNLSVRKSVWNIEDLAAILGE
ncbi:MAG TPA: NAD(P)H-hydrate dehydratase [Verrucomicrobiales bacterium]|nr:NAD(P)H-hydrate dehydratase [Verrucomicrobiales bacterium]HIL72296.1 NAD(P)H-hydrate dehydratase [Verrucomicrobiota bacterium]